MAATPKFTKAHSEAAKALAVAYESYFDAKRDNDHNGIRVWARALIDAQKATNVTLLTEAGLNSAIEQSYAAERRASVEA